MPKTVVYHGTPHATEALVQGLLASKATDSCPHIWLARHPADAAPYGEVLEVDMTGIPGDFEHGAWQGCYHGGDLAAWRLSLYTLPPESCKSPADCY